MAQTHDKAKDIKGVKGHISVKPSLLSHGGHG